MACRACGHLVDVRGFYVMAWAFPFIFFCMLASLLMAAGWKQYGLALMLAGSLLAIGLGGMVFGVKLRKRGWTDPEAVQHACAAHER